MRVDFFYPSLPPAADAIGESTALLAQQLAQRHDVRLLCDRPIERAAVPGVRLASGFSGRLPRGVCELEPALADDPPDWLLIPFNQFSFGPRGINPWLPWTVSRLRRRHSRLKVAMLAHEGFAPGGGPRATALSLIQRGQFLALGRLADVVLLATHHWVDQFRTWFPQATVGFLPIGSNLPISCRDRSETRTQYGLGTGRLLVTTFGGLGSGRNSESLSAALAEVGRLSTEAQAVYIGPAVAEFTALATTLRIECRALGHLPPEEAAAVLRASDMCISPFRGGVSMRRGSFLAGLQQGVASVTSTGPLTDPPLAEAAKDGAFRLLGSDTEDEWRRGVEELVKAPDLRARMGAAGQAYYRRRHDWPVVADSIEHQLASLTAIVGR